MLLLCKGEMIMELKEFIEMMQSEDFKERLKDEYCN